MSAAPLLLAVESSTDWLGVALLEGETPLETRREHHPGPGSERLLPLIDELLDAASLSLDAVAGFAVASGPGSFTGLRVGVATVKGLAFGAGRNVAAVSTLDALAHAAQLDDGIVVAALDARRGELYASATQFRPGVAPRALVSACVLTPEELAIRLSGAAGSLLVWVGDAPGAASDLGLPVEIREPPEGAPDPVWIGRLGARILAAGEGIAPEALAPWYLRRAEAEVRRIGQAFEPDQNGV